MAGAEQSPQRMPQASCARTAPEVAKETRPRELQASTGSSGTVASRQRWLTRGSPESPAGTATHGSIQSVIQGSRRAPQGKAAAEDEDRMSSSSWSNGTIQQTRPAKKEEEVQSSGGQPDRTVP